MLYKPGGPAKILPVPKGSQEGAGWSVGIPSDRLIRVQESSKPFKLAQNPVHGTKQIKSNSIFRAPLYIVWGVKKQGVDFIRLSV